MRLNYKQLNNFIKKNNYCEHATKEQYIKIFQHNQMYVKAINDDESSDFEYQYEMALLIWMTSNEDMDDILIKLEKEISRVEKQILKKGGK